MRELNFQKLITKIKENIELIVMAFSIVFFVSVCYLSFSEINNLSKEDIPEYDNLMRDSKKDYVDYTKNYNNKIKKMLEMNQIREITQYKYKNFVEKKNFDGRDNPFLKSF